MMCNRIGAIGILLCIVLFSSACRRHRRDAMIDRQVIDEDVPSITIIGSPDTKDDNPSIDSCDNILIPSIQYEIANQLLIRSSYIVSYNKTTKCPNWVAWHLTADHTDGPYRRQSSFYEELRVPSPRATLEDYRGSGWSRGHMCPAGDNKWDERAMYETFSLVNVCPQNANLNSGVWNSIEMDCRKWAKKYGDVYIVCGPIFLNREHETIGKNKVFVPEAFFKVILCLQGKPKAIGFIVKNNEGAKKKDQYINTVDEVERITGIDFFPALPDNIENEVEAHADINDWK